MNATRAIYSQRVPGPDLARDVAQDLRKTFIEAHTSSQSRLSEHRRCCSVISVADSSTQKHADFVRQGACCFPGVLGKLKRVFAEAATRVSVVRDADAGSAAQGQL